jgi:hypothetical protein
LSKFHQNQGIVDIGHKEESNELEVPKEMIISEPSMILTENKLTYQKRIQSERFDCETDFLGTETCSQQQSACPSNQEFTDGYSVAHHVVKNFLKQCEAGTILDGNRCYLDENNDGIKDYFYYTKSGGHVWSGVFLNNENNVKKEGNVVVPARGYLEVRHYSPEACDDDRNHVVVKINNITKIDTWCGLSKDTEDVIVYRNNTTSAVSVSYFYYDSHSGGGYDKSYFEEFIYAPNRIMIRDGFIEEKIDGRIYLYSITHCPNGSVEQPNGSCAMEYDWYSYLCPSEVNIYNGAWQVVNSGSDCGNIICTNLSTPPTNNCIRLNYTCSLDPNQKCGKTLNTIGACSDGYVWNNNRCERIESFCGGSFYNAILDICQDVTRYEKLCKNDNEIYNKITNICETGVEACGDGVYDENIDECVMDFIPECRTQGYVYNYVSGVCEDTAKSICETQYNYEGSYCRGEMTMCRTGYSYNEELNRCEQDACDILNTSDSGNRCETPSQCIGVVHNGKCIPNVVQ